MTAGEGVTVVALDVLIFALVDLADRPVWWAVVLVVALAPVVTLILYRRRARSWW